MKGLDLRIDGVNVGYIIQIISSAILTGKVLRVQVSEWREKRSLSQNATLWLWYGEIVQQIQAKTGDEFSTDDIHELFKSKYCPAKELTFGNKTIQVTSTKKLDKGEFHFYMNQVEQWAANAGFKLTTPIKSEYREIMERQND